MASIFSQIISGRAPAYRLWEDGEFLAFLDINPINPGHTLLVPKHEVEHVFDLPEALYARMWGHVRRLSAPLQAAMGSRKIGVAVEGFSVPHAHVHLVPVNRHGDLDPRRAAPATADELAAVQVRIIRVLGASG